MEIENIKVGAEKTNCYILKNETGEGVVIDPGAEAEKILDYIKKIGVSNLKYILLTHAHYDHVLAVDVIQSRFPKADVIIGTNDVVLYQMVPEQGVFVGNLNLKKQTSEVVAVSDGDCLPFGDKNIKVIATPGHTKGGICYFIDNILFSGDTLFYHTVGRTDLPEANKKDMGLSLDKLLHLPNETFVFPGHGRNTTILNEKNYWSG